MPSCPTVQRHNTRHTTHDTLPLFLPVYTISPMTAEAADMAPSTLDLLFLTFNCAKNFISIPVFAHHLKDAIGQNATGLPDLVAL